MVVESIKDYDQVNTNKRTLPGVLLGEVYKRLFVRGTAGGQGIRFLVDSGAQASILSENIGQKIGRS